jgi:hypothetical protein
MIKGALCNSYKQEAMQGLHSESDTYAIALYSADANLDEDTQAYTSLGEVQSRDGYAAGGKALQGMKVVLDFNTAVVTFNDVTWPNSTITARGALIFNKSKKNKAVAVLDFGRDIVSTRGLFEVIFPPANEDEGLIRWR